MMTGRNPAPWTELETDQDALHCKLQLLKQFIEIRQHEDRIPSEMAETLLVGVESALADSGALAVAMNRLAGAAMSGGAVSF